MTRIRGSGEELGSEEGIGERWSRGKGLCGARMSCARAVQTITCREVRESQTKESRGFRGGIRRLREVVVLFLKNFRLKSDYTAGCHNEGLKVLCALSDTEESNVE